MHLKLCEGYCELAAVAVSAAVFLSLSACWRAQRESMCHSPGSVSGGKELSTSCSITRQRSLVNKNPKTN